MERLNNINVTDFQQGLNTDSNPKNQPKGTYRFGLNMVNESLEGDLIARSNENSNEICTYLTPGYIPIGKKYIGKGETVILSVREDNLVSEIGILKNNCKYEVHVNDEYSSEKHKLGFNLKYQIDVTYRLRRGCERTIYFTAKNFKPKVFNFDSPQDFKNNDGTWNSKLFNLQKSYSSIPTFSKLEVLDSGGNLLPGSINVAIQYVDEGMNPTEFITASPTVKIYNDLSNKTFTEINGSINSDVDYMNFPRTGKALQINLDDLDPDFLYYRIAIIESNNGSGQVNSVRYTDVIPTSKNFFIYTGDNAPYIGTEEEIKQVEDLIYNASHIEQNENMLILGDLSGNPANFCKLQKYASRIKVDCVTKTVVLTDVFDPSNPKNPTHEIGGLGYMPGEIYSLGIVYIFEDGHLSPVYHIPGKSPDIPPNTIFSPGENTYPMSPDNAGTSTYVGNDSCGEEGYWGRDSEGTPLEDRFVRHHRFPLRSEIQKPLVEVLSEGDTQNIPYYKLVLKIEGDLKTPVECGEEEEDCTPQEADSFAIRVSYKVNGESFFFVTNVIPANYADGTGSYEIELHNNSNFHGSHIDMSSIVIEETDLNGFYQDEYSQWENYFHSSPTYTVTEELHTSSVRGRTYKTEILGLKFSGIDLPSTKDTNGEEIIGYYIVRNERTEFDKTIIDSGVLIPTVENEKYISHGLLAPETDKIRRDVWGLIHPEHKFNNKEYVVYDEIIQEGSFKISERKLGKITYNDVYDGTSWNPDQHKSRSQTDDDGFSIDIISRDNILDYKVKSPVVIPFEDIEENFYLSALESRAINDYAHDVFNISCDNTVGIIQFKNGVTFPDGELPYVIFKKEALDPYSNFRILPYYKESLNPHKFETEKDNETVIFNGDSYVSPMRYVNTMFWDNRVAKRVGKSNFLKTLLGVIVAVIGVVLSVFIPGASTVVVGAGIALIGAGALLTSSGIKMENVNKAYLEEYEKGLRQTLLDDWVDMFYNYRNTIPFGFFGNGGTGEDGPSDDSIQWVGDCLTDLWFETSINISLRNHMTTDMPTYLDAPGKIETGNDSKIETWEYFKKKGGANWTVSNSRYPVSALERHLAKKLLVFDAEREDARFYIGLALGEWYHVNPDYNRRNKEKVYFHLPLEYDCCSDCNESFPHRWRWSLQSFQEELTDNYRIFLPNNYRDLDGETGKITDIFSMGSDLFLHTEESLWKTVRNHQERVTDQIVSFIGTGEAFAIPPIPILDDETGMSAGTPYKWGTIKTSSGVFFVSGEKKIYKFNGQGLEPISKLGNSAWFRNNLNLISAEQYYDAKGTDYPYLNNPSNPFGVGFISTYDSELERIIFTKKDRVLSEDVIGEDDFEICVNNGEMILFKPFSEIIATKEADGWTYIGLNENCQMVFEKQVVKTRTEIRTTPVLIPDDTHIYAYFDISGSFNSEQLQSIRDAVDSWYSAYRPGDVGMSMLHKINFSTERWLAAANSAILDSSHSGNVLVLVFVNEAYAPNSPNSAYHINDDIINPVDSQPTTAFSEDYNQFKNVSLPTVNFFKGISYPIATNYHSYTQSRAFVQHTLLAINGVSYNIEEAGSILDTLDDSLFNLTHKSDLLATLLYTNPYASLGTPLKDLGWLTKVDRNDLDYENSEGAIPIITPEQFAEDINHLLIGDEASHEETEVEVEYLETEYSYVEGEVIREPIVADNSWTMSFCLKQNMWISWHSYMPNFYIHTPNKFYSWNYGSPAFWKHNVKGKFQQFYGNKHPFIIDMINTSNAFSTKIWDSLSFNADFLKYDFDLEDYVVVDDTFFTEMIAYNSKQSSGLMKLKVKDANPDKQNYMTQQITNLSNDEILVSKEEETWYINELRDLRIDYSEPIFNTSLIARQNQYYIDKVLNTSSIDYDKDWTQMESFRDKYLAVRLIFDNFDNAKLILNFSVENETQSFR